MKRVRLKKSVYGAEKRILPNGVWSGKCKTTNGNHWPIGTKLDTSTDDAVRAYKARQRKLTKSFNTTRAKIIARKMRKANERARTAAH